MKKVLITGASGFIGRHTIDKLLALGYEVHCAAHKNPLEHLGGKWHKVDLLNYQETSELIAKIKPTHLLHLAWDVSPGYLHSLKNFEWVSASFNLIKEFRKNDGKRVVTSGTCLQYKETDEPYNEETTPREPSFVYGNCKQALQMMLEIFCKQTELSYAWGYVFFLYGKYETPNRLVPAVINALLKNEPLDCTDGLQIRDFLYVDDLADAFVKVLDSELQGSINIASGKPIQIKEIVNKIVTISKKENTIKLGGKPNPENERHKIVANTQKLEQELKWTPKHTLEEGLKATFNLHTESN